MRNKTWEALCSDISDRRGLKWEWDKIDEDVKDEIRKAWEEILRNEKDECQVAKIEHLISEFEKNFVMDIQLIAKFLRDLKKELK